MEPEYPLALQDDGNCSVVYVHDLAVVYMLAHRIEVMERGRLVEIGDRDQILKNPQEEYTK